MVQPRPLEHVHVHQPAVDLDGDYVIRVRDRLEAAVHERLVQIEHQGLLVGVLRPLRTNDRLRVHARRRRRRVGVAQRAAAGLGRSRRRQRRRRERGDARDRVAGECERRRRQRRAGGRRAGRRCRGRERSLGRTAVGPAAAAPYRQAAGRLRLLLLLLLLLLLRLLLLRLLLLRLLLLLLLRLLSLLLLLRHGRRREAAEHRAQRPTPRTAPGHAAGRCACCRRRPGRTGATIRAHWRQRAVGSGTWRECVPRARTPAGVATHTVLFAGGVIVVHRRSWRVGVHHRRGIAAGLLLHNLRRPPRRGLAGLGQDEAVPIVPHPASGPLGGSRARGGRGQA
jgi:hypothetical protein